MKRSILMILPAAMPLLASTTPIPEPSSMLLVGGAVGVLFLVMRRRKNSK